MPIPLINPLTGWLDFCPLVVPHLPPSGNNIRVTNWRKKMQFLTKEAKQFQRDFVESVSRDVSLQIKLRALDRSLPYEVCYYFFFPVDEIINTTYGLKGGAKDRYKKMDTENRVKLVSDCLSLAIDIDDKQFFDGSHRKRPVTLVGGVPQIHIWLRPLDPTALGL